MENEPFNDQRPIVITAVIVAALTAAGLWYFLVFRPAEAPTSATETPTPLTSETPFVMPEITLEPTHVPLTENPVESTMDIQPTAATGPAEMVMLAALVATGAGLLGFRTLARP